MSEKVCQFEATLPERGNFIAVGKDEATVRLTVSTDVAAVLSANIDKLGGKVLLVRIDSE